MSGVIGDLDTRAHWEGVAEHKLLVQRCSDCGRYRWQPRALCYACQSWNFTWEEMSGRATVYTWTVAHRAMPTFAEDVPFLLVMVQLAEQDDLMMIGRLPGVDPETLRGGEAVTVEFVELHGVTVPSWRLAEAG